MTSIAEWLQQAGAQHDVVEWAEPFASDWDQLWDRCPRGDWMLAIAARLQVGPEQLVAAACKCARLGLLYVGDDQERLAKALESAEQWRADSPHPSSLAQAREEVADAASSAADPAIAAAAQGALAAMDTIDSGESAAHAVACVTQAAVLDAGDCGMMAALRFTQGRCAQLVREAVPVASIKARAADLIEN